MDSQASWVLLVRWLDCLREKRDDQFADLVRHVFAFRLMLDFELADDSVG